MTDQRYGTFKYGTSHKYGALSTGTTEALAWGIEIDWNADGVFDHGNESDHLIKAPSIKRGRRTMLRPSGQGFESIRTGQAVVVLSNHDGRYDAWNTASPLYPIVESGKDIRIRVRDLYTGIIYNRFYGIVQDIVPSGYGKNAIVTIYADDAIRELRDTEVTAKRSYPDGINAPFPLPIDTCIGILLDAIQWPTKWGRNLDSTDYGIRYWYASGDRDVATEINDLVLSFFGYWFITNDGKLRFMDWKNNQTSGGTISENEILKDIGNPQPWIIRRNVVKIRFHVRKNSDDIFVWQPLYTEPAIEPGETASYFIEYTNNGYPAFLEDLATGFDFVKVQGVLEQGGNYNVTTSVTDYGTRAFISITNNEAFPLYLFPDDVVLNPTSGDATYIRGDITWTEKSETISSPRNPASLTNQRSLVLDSLWYQNKSQAFDFVDNYKAFISIQHKTPIIQIENRFALQFSPDLFDVRTIDIPFLGINMENFRIGGIEEESIGETTQAVRTTFYLEPFLTPITGMGLWDSGQWNTAKWSW